MFINLLFNFKIFFVMRKATILGLIGGGLALIGAGIAAYKNRDKIERLADKIVARLKEKKLIQGVDE